MGISEIAQIYQIPLDLAIHRTELMFGFSLNLFVSLDFPSTMGLNTGTFPGLNMDWVILAQQFDTDPFAGIREWFVNLVETGQLWALIFGFVLGYLFRGFTSYG